jgi:zinc transport system substrate-binding protein
MTNGCKMKSVEKTPEVISVSILPQKFFIDQLTGGSVKVNVMVPPGAGHATYEPTAQQLQSMSQSRLYVSMGHLGYEQTWLKRLTELSPDMVILNLSDSLNLITSSEKHNDHTHNDGIDPHIWMSPKVVAIFMPRLKTALLHNFPLLTDTIEKNYALFMTKLNNLSQKTDTLVSLLPQKKFLIFHPALTYLARDYGLTQIPIEQDGKEPSPAFLADLIQKAKNEKIPVIFIQKEYDIRNAQLIGREANVQIEQINPMAYNWLEEITHITESLEKYLSASKN